MQNLTSYALRVFSRPHPQATAGQPVSFQYSPDSRVSEHLHFLISELIFSYCISYKKIDTFANA